MLHEEGDGMNCPRCGSILENFNWQEGGWCPVCKEWYPPDIVRDAIEEEYDDAQDELEEFPELNSYDREE